MFIFNTYNDSCIIIFTITIIILSLAPWKYHYHSATRMSNESSTIRYSSDYGNSACSSDNFLCETKDNNDNYSYDRTNYADTWLDYV